MAELAKLVSDPTVFRLGLALIHFLWQGVALALVAWLLLLAFRGARPGVRYLALLVVLAAMAASPAITFSQLRQISPIPQTPRLSIPLLANMRTSPQPTAPPSRSVSPVVTDQEQAPPAAPREPLVSSVRQKLLAAWGWVVSHAQWFALVWVVAVVLRSGRLLLRWRAAAKGRRQATPLREERWERALAVLAERVRVTRAVQLLESALVQAPAVMGWLRPAILLPVSTLTGLTPEHLEAVLAHELGHIRRHDYLINMVQTVIEILLFYHPAVWWVSRRIRIEREHCCDDVAVAACGSVVTYTRALTELERLRTPMLELMVAASGTPLLGRIRRLVTSQQEDVRQAPSWFAAIVPVLAVVALVGAPHLPARAERVKSALPVSYGAFPICRAKGDQVDPNISRDIVVWTDYRNNPPGHTTEKTAENSDIYGYDLRTGREFPICTAHGYQIWPAIDGNIVVWVDFRNEAERTADIYGYDLSTGTEFAICTDPAYQNLPNISGDLVVWEDSRGSSVGTGSDIWGYSISEGREFPICTAPAPQYTPVASGTVVVWQDWREEPGATTRNNDPKGHNADIYGRDLAGGPEFPVCTNPYHQEGVRISGRTVVWQDYRSDSDHAFSSDGTDNLDVYAYDLDSKREFSIATGLGMEWGPLVFMNRVAYMNGQPGKPVVISVYDLSTAARSSIPTSTLDGNDLSDEVVVGPTRVNEAKTGSDIYGYRLPDLSVPKAMRTRE